MSKKIMLVALCSLLLALSFPAEAQQATKVPRIGYLDSSSRSVNAHFLEAFQKGLNELGWAEGKNIAFEYRFADGKGPAYQAELAGELVRLKVDLIVAASASVQRAKEATSQIPIVMTIHPNPVEAGIVQSLARPGGNITGLTNLAAEISSKRLELLKEVVPKLRRVGVLMPAQTPTWDQQSGLALKDLEATARSLQVKLQELRVKVGPTEIDLDGAFKIAAREQLGAIILMPWARFGEEQKRIADLAIARRLPTISGQGYTESGILMSYGANSLDLYRRAAVFVDKILKGAKPADLPVEQPTKFEFVINLKTAKQIGLTIPPNVLARADKVIK
jgi:ABC-type uncharacterized transport system substrate-binding protein